MDENTRELLEGVYPYFIILDNVNRKLIGLIDTNKEKLPHQNEELFYQIVSDLIRVYPYSQKKVDIKLNNGILLLREHIPFLIDEYRKLLDNEQCVKALNIILKVRNKYEHEPHNMQMAFCVGSNTSCSMMVYYKDQILPMSTIWLTNIIYELNEIFVKIKELYMQTINKCDEKYKQYPCCTTIYNINFLRYNQQYNRLPWSAITICDDDNLS